MGFFTCHDQVVLFPAFFFDTRLPFATAIRLPGTVTWIKAPRSGSSLWWSLQGYQTLAPRPWQATVIHGRPFESLVKIQPPSHGGLIATLGLPVKYMVIESIPVAGGFRI